MGGKVEAPSSLKALGLRTYADRIETAAKHHFREATKMISDYKNLLHLCNAAKMREALVRAQRVLHCAIVAEILKGDDAQEALNVVTAALSAPPRNCDVLSKDEVLKVLDDRSFSKEDTIEWLYTEAKGGTDGSK